MQPVELTEVLVDESPGEPWVHFRFVAPQIGQGSRSAIYESAAADMDYICDSLVLPYLEQFELTASRVIISLSDQEVPFGESMPEATQFFQGYRPDAAGCIWEEY